MLQIIVGALIFAVGVLFGVGLSHNSKTEDGFLTLAKILEQMASQGISDNRHMNECPICGLLPGKYDTVKQANDEFRHHMRAMHADEENN
jgi:hypothetical protein